MLRAPLIHFLMLGGLLFGLQSIRSEGDDAEVVVEVERSRIDEAIEAHRLRTGRAPDEAERAALEREIVEESIWLADARRRSLHEVDPVVRTRLVLNMRFLDDSHGATDAELFERALELGLDRSDPVVRRRLVDRAQASVRDEVRARPIDDAALERHRRRTSDRWRIPPSLDLSHVYLSRDVHGAALPGRADALLARLRSEGLPPDRAIGLGDPFLVGHRMRAATPSTLSARFGVDFELALREAPTNTWVGPVSSAFGLHAVWIHERAPARVPPLAEIRARVLEDWLDGEIREALRAHIERRRAEVELHLLERDRSAADQGASMESTSGEGVPTLNIQS